MPNTGDMEIHDFIKGLEKAIQKAVERMDEAQRANDTKRFTMASQAWIQAQGLWLQAARNMSVEKAYAVMIGFANSGELAAWLDNNRPGRPPSVLDLYKEE